MHQFEEKLVLKDFLYHGLSYEILDNSTIKISLHKLVNIIRAGGILSRQKIKEQYGDKYFDKLSKNLLELNWNGEAYVSICKFLTDDKDATYVSEAYRLFCRDGITLIIDKSILNSAEIDKYGSFQDGEIRVKDEIPLTYVKGILINILSPSTTIKHQKNKGVPTPEIQKHIEEVYNNGLNQVFQILSHYNLDLPLYSSHNGRLIKTYDETLQELNNVGITPTDLTNEEVLSK